jgi:hypothetical protein
MSITSIVAEGLRNTSVVLTPVRPAAPAAPPGGPGPHALSLGDVTFAGFEIPESLPLGGAQMLGIQKLPGGTRVVDAIGPDEADIHWTGRFRGANGSLRARRLDTMRAQGLAVALTFGEFHRKVVIRAFAFDIRNNALEIPYSLTLTVIENQDFPVLRAPPATDALVAADMDRMRQIGGSVASVSSAVSTALTAYQAVKSIRSGNYAAIGSVIGSAATLAQSVDLPMTGLLGSLVSLSGVATSAIHDVAPLVAASGIPGGGLPGADAAALITGAVANFTSLTQLLELRDLADRAGANVGNRLGQGTTWTGPRIEGAAP